MAMRESFAAQDVVRQRREPIARERSFVIVNEEEVGYVPLRVVVVEVRDAALERLRAGAEQRVTTAFEREETIDVADLRTLPKTCPRRSTRELGLEMALALRAVVPLQRSPDRTHRHYLASPRSPLLGTNPYRLASER